MRLKNRYNGIWEVEGPGWLWAESGMQEFRILGMDQFYGMVLGR